MTASLCNEIPAMWDAYRRDELGAREHAAVEAHFASCEECAEYGRILKGVDALAADVTMDPLLERRLSVAAVNLVLPERPSPWPRVAWTVGPSLVAAAAAIAIMLYVTHEPDTGSGVAPSDGRLFAEVDTDYTPTSPVQIASIADGRQIIEVLPGTALWLSGSASVQLVAVDDEMARFRLDRGRVVAEVGSTPAGFRFIVATPSGESEARGTLYSVEVHADGRETTRVYEGVVEVRETGSGVSHLVSAKDEVSIGDGEPRPASTGSLAADRCLAEGCSDPGIDLAADEETYVAIRAAGGRAPQGEVELSSLVEQARSYRRVRQFERAADTYKHIIDRFGGTNEAMSGLVALGQIEQTALGDPAAALGHFERYLKLAPRGYLGESARAGIVRSLTKAGRFGDAVGAANTYFEHHSRGFSMPEILRLRANALLRLGRCAHAVSDFNEVMKRWPDSRESKRAAAGIEACGQTPRLKESSR